MRNDNISCAWINVDRVAYYQLRKVHVRTGVATGCIIVSDVSMIVAENEGAR